MNIKLDDLKSLEVQKLLDVHLRESRDQNPGGNSHALAIAALKDKDVSFWTVWSGGDLMGFGALREIAPALGELKSMHTAKDHRRKGVSSALIEHMIKVGRERGYSSLKLETHPTQGYAAARKLYERHGFSYCGPFGAYQEDPNSVFMSLDL